jgi:hypothetical protein
MFNGLKWIRWSKEKNVSAFMLDFHMPPPAA